MAKGRSGEAQVYDIRNSSYPLGTEGYWVDTSALVTLRFGGPSSPTVRFLERAQEIDAPGLYSPVTIGEFRTVCLAASVERKARSLGIPKEQVWADGRLMEELKEDVSEAVRDIRNNVNLLNVPVPTDNAFAEIEQSLYSTYHLRSFDETHLATALHYRINSVLTSDRDFIGVPFVNIYVDRGRILRKADNRSLPRAVDWDNPPWKS